MNGNQTLTMDCIKVAQDLSGKTIYNICTGQQQYIPYGSLDLIVGWGFGAMFLGVVICMMWGVSKSCRY